MNHYTWKRDGSLSQKGEEVAKLNTMYKVHNNLVPDYLKHIFPSTRSKESKYNTRNREDYTIPKCRLELYRKSFVPTQLRNGTA